MAIFDGIDDTIAALATAPGEGGIAIIRVSGPGAEGAMRSFFSAPASGRIKSHYMYYGRIINAGEPEEALCVLMRAPRSYTRQDVCEFQIHGGSAPAARLLSALYKSGIRPAKPGEFTRRAFLNGRVDLSRAEAVMRVMAASSEAALKRGLRELNGGISTYINGLKEKLTGIIAKVEAALDFPDEIEVTDIEREVRSDIESIIRELREKISGDTGSIISDGVNVTLYGKPNVGKSSLLNALTGSERAIVTDIAGTTRDVISEYCEIGGYRVRLSDTAGQRATSDEIEKIGVERARRETKNADIALLVLDTSTPLDDDDKRLLTEAKEGDIVLLNKSDRPAVFDEGDVRAYCGARLLSVSAQTGKGVPELKQAIAERLNSVVRPDAVFVHQRHIACALSAADQLEGALAALAEGQTVEFAALDLRGALNSLCEITGETAGEDVIDRIFNDFCVGK